MRSYESEIHVTPSGIIWMPSENSLSSMNASLCKAPSHHPRRHTPKGAAQSATEASSAAEKLTPPRNAVAAMRRYHIEYACTEGNLRGI
eukprot:4060437-Pyramimonas_sp.AAC.2